ncbi:Holliday junction resolvase RuvX [Flagellimonas meridianipacifica]|uniref:Putative pre-16S rRNA nuclease n=1 Tax=Flagellimonas meridianipacifica TaxID=1080225 RepID=A0A2T0M9C3_9FLAO|nr:Holliday junction resolvase RuvX [Allomuricauda pacifica]PRX54111.1 putative Holliday junction resolvase [Allomuricauda pacifica]
MARILALDYGKVRTGIAVTDEMQIIASGLTTVETKDLISFLQNYIVKEKVELFVMGLPKQMDNTPSESETMIQAFLDKLKKQFPDIPVERQDERFTSKIAFQSLVDSGIKKSKRREKGLVDEISATLILQAYLERKV